LRDEGYWDTLAGQPTDDSELALMLARSIVRSDHYDADEATRAYAYWISSIPFDVGGTTRQALGAIQSDHDYPAEQARRAANEGSQANGSLMRISPLAIWGWRVPPDDLARLAAEDSRLTHPNHVCLDAVAVFCIAVATAIRDGTSARETYDTAVAWAEAHAGEEVVRALHAAAEPGESQPAIDERNTGWVIHALRNAFHQLLYAPSLEEGVVRTVGLGGDTDTNACISGALLGAVYGRAAIPRAWQLEVLSCRPMQQFGARRVRPRPFWPVDALYLAEALLVLGERTTADMGSGSA
jgi:ADP-ribosylglycohydrolase